MKVVIVQQDIIWANPEGNLAALDRILAGLPAADLYVLPEMFTTGFATQPEGIAEEFAGGSCAGLEWMKAMAKSRDCAVAGSIAVHDGGKYCNRLFFVTPESVSCYDKHHLFTYSGEHLRYTAGDRKVTVEWRGWRIRLIVCYDLRFPKWIRNGAGQPYDALICVASWPDRRAGAWKTLVRARAIENQCYVLAVNRAGKDPSCMYSGDSAIIDPWGETLAACTPSVEGFATAELDMEGLEAFRRQFPVLDDADE